MRHILGAKKPYEEFSLRKDPKLRAVFHRPQKYGSDPVLNCHRKLCSHTKPLRVYFVRILFSFGGAVR